MSIFLRFLALSATLSITTWGLVDWTVQNFTLVGLWPFAGPFMLHPVHLLAIGLAALPAAFKWVLELSGRNPSRNLE